jgi:23S rRNA (uracil1939-C5)-methyltransferase
MNIDDRFTVKIIDQETNGRGVAKIDDFVVFVTGALPKENCNIIITNVKKNYAEADVVKVINGSDERITNDCPYIHHVVDVI